MAENTYINKVVLGNDTLLDLTEDSVTENTLLEGETAHKASGEPITGTAKQGHTIQNIDGTDLTQRNKLQFKGSVNATDDSTNGRTVIEVTGVSDNPTFTEASARANIVSGESFSTILGKIKKFFSDLKTVAFSGSYNDLSNKPTIPTDFVSKANGGRFWNDITIDRANGTASAEGYSTLYIGNATPIGQAGNSIGQVALCRGQHIGVLLSGPLTDNRWAFLPDKTGTIALTSDITDVTSYAFTPSANSQVVESSINKVGRIVDCQLVLQILSSTSQSSIQLGTIQTGARPLANQSQVFFIGEGILTTITVATNGVVYSFANTSALNWTLRIQFTYISAT